MSPPLRPPAELESMARTACSEGLQESSNPRRSDLILLRLHQEADIEIDKVDQMVEETPPHLRAFSTKACKAGCWHCCHQVVSATAPEVIRVAEYVRSHFSEPQLSDLKERIEAYRAEMAGKHGEEYDLARVVCPLLKDGLCSVWEARPFACKGYNSTSVAICELNKRIPRAHAPIPQVQEQIHALRALAKGVRAGLKDRGLDDHPLELGVAIGVALEDASAGEKYFKGEDPFVSARAEGY